MPLIAALDGNRMPDAPQLFSIGPHRLRFEPPDLFCMEWIGDVAPEHMLALFEVTERMAEGRRPLFGMVNVTRMGTMGGETRKVTASDPRMKLLAATAFVGASFPTRVLATMLQKAYALFRRNDALEVAFFDEEAPARGWLAEQRERLAKRPLPERPSIVP
jgi:hypothetical protein